MTTDYSDQIATDNTFKDLQITEKQIKNFITQKEACYRRALDKKNSIDFGNLDTKTAHEQLTEICKY